MGPLGNAAVVAGQGLGAGVAGALAPIVGPHFFGEAMQRGGQLVGNLFYDTIHAPVMNFFRNWNSVPSNGMYQPRNRTAIISEGNQLSVLPEGSMEVYADNDPLIQDEIQGDPVPAPAPYVPEVPDYVRPRDPWEGLSFEQVRDLMGHDRAQQLWRHRLIPGPSRPN